MSKHQNTQPENPDGPQEPLVGKRQFLGKLGRWSGASIAAVIGGAAWLSSSGSATAASWINRGGGGWVNRGGSSWVNGGGSWVVRDFLAAKLEPDSISFDAPFAAAS